MGKRVPVTDHGHHVTPTTRTIRKRKRTFPALRLSGDAIAAATAVANWHENDDEDSSNDTLPEVVTTPARYHQASSKHANNSSILLNASFNTSALAAVNADSSVNESPKPVYTLRPSVVNGTVLRDLAQKSWRLGRPIGKGNFGEIFLASDNITIPVTNENAKFVVKIEPHSNGPLFVEIHCLINTAKNNPNNNDDKDDIKMEKKEDKVDKKPISPAQQGQIPRPSGIPDYIASGSHYFGDARYRFLVLKRFDRDLHSLIRNCRVGQKSVLTLAIQIINVLERLHDKGYCHNDVKAQNLMISKCKYQMTKEKSSAKLAAKTEIKEKYQQKTHDYEEKQQTTDSGNSSEQEETNDNANDEDYAMPSPRNSRSCEDEEEDDDDDNDDDEDFDDGETTNSNNSNSMDLYKTPVNKMNRKRVRGTAAAASSANASERRGAIAARASTSRVEYSGSNPVRSCRRKNRNSIYEEMVTSHYLRPTKRISYSEFFNEDGISIRHGGSEPRLNNSIQVISSDDDDSEEFVPASARRNQRSTAKKSTVTAVSSSSSSNSSVAAKRLTRRQEKLLASSSAAKQQPQQERKHHNRVAPTAACAPEWITVEEERLFLIDFGLASKFMDNGVHRPFFMDQRRAHDGTLEFTSRDAHMGAHSRRSDLECLGYNMLFWSQGYLPWKEAATHQQQEQVHRAKEYLMTDVREMLKQIYGKQVPKFLGEFLHHVGQLAYHERPDYAYYRRLFEGEFQQIIGGGGGEVEIAAAVTAVNEDVMRLDSREIMRTCVRFKEEIENNTQNDLLELNKRGEHNHVWSIMKNLAVVGVGTPFHERTLSNRVSPKNLRSSIADRKTSVKKKKFSWAEILSQDPDQIARERAEKEFDREEESDEVQQPTVRRYEGKPTYAIREIQQRLIASGRLLPAENKKEGLAEVVEEEAEEMEQEEKEEEDAENNECEDDEEEVDEEYAEDADEDEEDEEVDEDKLEAEETHEDDEQEPEQDGEDEDESETSDPEVSEQEHQQKTNERSRRARNSRATKTKTATKTSKTSTASKITSSGAAGGGRGTRGGSGRKRGGDIVTEATTTPKKRSSKTTTTKASSGKQARTKNLANGGEDEVGHQQKPPMRRTRGSLIKTDKGEAAQERQHNAMSEDDDDVVMMESEGSNSNFSPDVHSLFNVWKKINNETIYFRGSKVAGVAARQHCKKRCRRRSNNNRNLSSGD